MKRALSLLLVIALVLACGAGAILVTADGGIRDSDSGRGGGGRGGRGGSGGGSIYNGVVVENASFWKPVVSKIRKAAPGETVRVSAVTYKEMPEMVMAALRAFPNVSLEIRISGGRKIIIPAGGALERKGLQNSYSFSSLLEHYGTAASAAVTDAPAPVQPAKSSASPSGRGNGDTSSWSYARNGVLVPNASFWNPVVSKIRKAEPGETISISATTYKEMPEMVMAALRAFPDVSLEIRISGGRKVIIPAGGALERKGLQNRYSFSSLLEHYGAAAPASD